MKKAPGYETLAQQICANPKFVAQIRDIVTDYRIAHDWHRSAPTAGEMRKQLAEFERRSSKLLEWIDRALCWDASGQAYAARALHTASMEQGFFARDELEAAQERMRNCLCVVVRARDFLQADKRTHSAPLMAADSLRKTFERFGLRCTAYENSAAVLLLVEIAKAAGDRSLTKLAAKKSLGASHPARRNTSEAKTRRIRS
jgi:hypothetical protein